MHCQAPATPTAPPPNCHRLLASCFWGDNRKFPRLAEGGGEDGRCSRRECVVVAPNGVVLICELCIFATFSHCWQLDLPQVAHATTELCKVALAEALRNFDFTDSWCRAENNKPNTHRYASNIYMCVCCVWHDSINLDAKVSRLLRQKAQHAQSGRLHKSCERALSWQRQGLCKVVGEC